MSGHPAALIGGRLAAAVELLDVRLARVEAGLGTAPESGEFRYDLQHEVQWSRFATGLAYDIEVALLVYEADPEQPVVTATATFWVVYGLDDEFRVTDEEADAFGEASAMFTAYPYVREFVHDLTARMGLPPLILPTIKRSLRPPVDDKPATE